MTGLGSPLQPGAGSATVPGSSADERDAPFATALRHYRGKDGELVVRASRPLSFGVPRSGRTFKVQPRLQLELDGALQASTALPYEVLECWDHVGGCSTCGCEARSGETT